MSYLDYGFLVIIFVSVLIGIKKGLIGTLFSFASTLIGIFLAYFLYPNVSAMLVKYTGLYQFIMNKAIKALDLEKLAQGATSKQGEISVIQNLKVPEFLKELLVHHKNPVVYDLLKATNLEEYIGGTIATMAINALSFLIVLVIVMLLLNIMSHVLNIVSKLPVIHQLNTMGGLAVGLAQGLIFIWIICILLSFVIAVQGNEKLLLLVNHSPVVMFFYQNNFIMKFISNLPKAVPK